MRQPRPIRWQLDRRPGEFNARSPVPLRSGSACCCCCIHWIGAVAGGILGVFYGYTSTRPRPRAARLRFTALFVFLGFIAGLLLAALLARRHRAFFEALFYVPCLAIAFGAAGILLVAYPRHFRLRRRIARNPRAVICPGCDYDLRASIEAGRCPECGRPIDDQCYVRMIDSGWDRAWHAAAWSAAASLAGTGLGWLVLLLLLTTA